jgi:iduronate 2-sulfatase
MSVQIFRIMGFLLCLSLTSKALQAVSDARTQPNVLLILCDDLNDFVGGFGGHPQTQTPALERFAKTAVTFRHAYSNNPVCAPSRASFFTGIYPHTSRNLFWDKWYENPVLKNSKTIMEFFRENGYYVAGTGKNEHHHRRSDWSAYGNDTDYGPYWYDGKARVANPWVLEPFNSIGCIDGSFGPLRMDHADQPEGSGWKLHWGKEKILDFSDTKNRDLTADEINAKWAVEQLEKFSASTDDEPFFLSIGFVRPHTPLHAPQEYFDRFPLESLEMPPMVTDDASDTALHSVSSPDDKGYKYFRMLAESYGSETEGIKVLMQSYLACVAAVDDSIKQVLEALEKSPLRDNTVVIITSDHGWDMGQKDYIFKNTLWEGSARIPMLIRVPGVSKAGGIAEQPVSLIDIYPTLVDLCDLKGDTRKNMEGAKLDGYSLRPFLKDPKSGKWNGPDGALTMRFAGGGTNKELNRQHWSYRTKYFRYIRYNNGAEELYDHRNDPYEFNNLAHKTKFLGLKNQLHQRIKDQLSLSVKLTKDETGKQKAAPKKDAIYWKDFYFSKNPSADTDLDGLLSWSELNAHKAKNN